MIIKIISFIFNFIWIMLCAVPAFVLFYFLECLELAKIFSSKIEKTLGD